MAARTDFERRMLVAIVALREGEVVSYGDIAAAAGKPDAPRAAGRFLSQIEERVPWWRVVYSNGRIAACNIPKQRSLLEAEGVQIKSDRVIAAPLGRFANRHDP